MVENLSKDKNVSEKSIIRKHPDAKNLNLTSACIFGDNELLFLVSGAISSETKFTRRSPKRYQDLSSFPSKFQMHQFFDDRI